MVERYKENESSWLSKMVDSENYIEELKAKNQELEHQNTQVGVAFIPSLLMNTILSLCIYNYVSSVRNKSLSLLLL